jgi:hypothetical protein
LPCGATTREPPPPYVAFMMVETGGKGNVKWA